jgi:hypothetical protein
VLPAISGEAKDERTLTSSAGTWTGSPTITYGYQWESCNTSGEACTSISGATSSTYTIAHEEVGRTVRVKVTAKNSAGEASASSAQTGTVAASAPANTVLPAISGEAKDERTLTSSAGTWTGSPTITYSYQWELCNGKGESCSAISGATSSTYVLGHGDVGSALRVVVTATNSAGSASKSSEASSVVAASPPADVSPPTIVGTAEEGQTLSATPGTWSGSEPLEYTSYAWKRCKAGSCQPISGASGPTDTSYVLTAADVWFTIEVTVTARNSVSEASATSEPTREITAVAPQNTAPPVIAGAAQSGQTLTASTGTWSGTTPLTYSYLWEECNSHGHECQGIASAMSASYTISSSSVGHTIRVTVTAENVAGSTMSSSEATTTVLEAGCTDGWAGPSEGAWETPGYWSTGKVPGPADTACIPAGGSVRVREGTSEAGALHSKGEVVISGGTLNLANGAKASEVVSLTQRGGTITGPGVLDVSSSLSWAGGTMEGASTTILGRDAASTIGSVTLADRELINEGTLTLEREIASGWASPGILDNTGTLQKTTGAGAAVIGVKFGNEGTVSASSGSLELTDGGISTAHPGTWSAASACTIVFGGGEFDLGSSATFSGTITLTDGAHVDVQQISAANAELNVAANGSYQGEGAFLDVDGPAPSTIGTLNVHGAVGSELINVAVLGGAGQVDVTKAFTAGDFAYLEGTGNTVIEPGATATVSSSLGIEEEHKLENDGTLTISEGASIGGGKDGTFVNTGTLEKTEGSGTATIASAFANEGAVSVTSGTLELTGGGTSRERHPGSWSASASAKLLFNSAETFALGSSVALAGTIEIAQGPVTAGTINGPSAVVTVNGTEWSRRGTLEVNGETPSTLNTLILNDGHLAGSGTISVGNSFAGNDRADLSGSGVLELQPSASGTISGTVYLEERTLENAGTLTIGAQDVIEGSKHARLVNSGTLNVNAESPVGEDLGLVAGTGEATVINTGVIQKTEGSTPALISFAIDNDGTINADSGTLEFTGGGESGDLASDTWTAASGAAIELNGFASGIKYSLGANATITGSMHLDANVTAGTIKGTGANLTTLHSAITLTGLTASELGSLTFLQAPPDIWVPQEQQVSIVSELQIDDSLMWTSYNAALEGPGAIVTEPGSTTVFSAFTTHFDGGQFINEGTATWEAGQLAAEPDHGTFFVNYGTFHADAQGFEPLMRGCVREVETGFHCPVFENDGIFAAELPHTAEGYEPVWPHIAWDVDILNYGDLEVAHTQEMECPGLPPYGWESEQCVAEQQGVRETYAGLLLKEGAEVKEPPWEVWITGEEEEGQVLTANTSSLPWKPTPSISYQWQVCGSEEAEPEEHEDGWHKEEWEEELRPGECRNIEGATSATLELGSEDVGYAMRVVAAARNAHVSRSATSPETAAVWASEAFNEEEAGAEEEGASGDSETFQADQLLREVDPNDYVPEEPCSPTHRVCGDWSFVDTQTAYEYAELFAHHANHEYYETYENDCANYVSQILHEAAVPFLADNKHVNLAWWTREVQFVELGKLVAYNHDHTNTWTVAESLYYEMLHTGLARPLKKTESPEAGDIVFFHWFPSKTPINHVGMIVSGSNADQNTELYTSHTEDRLWSMAQEFKQIGIYLHELKSSISPSEDARGLHWQWYVLRPIHSDAYVP